jgi:hypothetical protein
MTDIDIGPTQRKILRILSDGGRLTLEWHYPYDRQYWCYKLGGLIPIKVSDDCLASMLDRKLIRHSGFDGKGDKCEYTITDHGQAVLAAGSIAVDDGQMDLLPGYGHARMD